MLPATPVVPRRHGPATRNPGIDALRGLSILLVVVHHLSLRLPLKQTALADIAPARLVSALSWNGWSAVYVFFVISGFLIALHALQRHGTLARIELRTFYVRRAARILPLLLLLLAVLALLHGLGVPDYTIGKPGQSLAGALGSALTLWLNWYEAVHGWLPGNWDVLWSLSIEEAFYLGFPLACLLLRSERLLFGVLALFALSLPWQLGRLENSGEIWQEKAYLPAMAAIAGGICAAIIATRTRPDPRQALALRLLGGAGLLVALLFAPWLWRAIGNGMMLLLTLSVAVLLLGLQAGVRAGPGVPGLGWLRALGRLSYEIYLSHMFVVFSGVAGYRALGGEPYAALWLYPPAVLLCWALGAVLARICSVPAERRLRRRWLAAAPAAPSAAPALGT